MRVSSLAAIAGQCLLTSAQIIDLAFINAEPDPTYTVALDVASQTIAYNQASAIASDRAESGSDSPLDVVVTGPTKRNIGISGPIIEARQAACAAAPSTPNIYNATLDPAESFLADSNLAQQAQQAQTPAGYTKTFTNLKAASQAHGYMGFSLLSSYDAAACAAKCNKAKLCQSFNIYFERSPSRVPGTTCPNPAATGNIYCVLWGGPVYPENTKNVGQWRAQFHVVIAGSNGYTLTSALGPNNAAAIDAPQNCNNASTFLGMRLFTDGAPFDPQRCAAVCSDTSSYNINNNPNPSQAPALCKFFNTYIISRNYVSQGQYCALYSQYWDPAVYATNFGQNDTSGNRYTISSSVFFKNATDVATPVCPADVQTLQQDPAAGAFCTSYNSVVAPVTTVTVTSGTTTVQRCAAASTTLAARKRDAAAGEFVEAVLAVYPEKVNAHSTGTAASVTIAAESITVAAALASATSQAASSLGVTITSSAVLTTTTPAAHRRQVLATPSVLQSRDPREISSVCSRVATGASTTTQTVQATETSDANCAQYPSVCTDGSTPSLLFGDFNQASQSYDDYSTTVELPFPICIYDSCSSTVHPTTNGLITLGDFATATYTNYPIPVGFDGGYSTPALYVFWDDLYIYAGQRHYMDYSICGTPGSRSVTFDWRMGRYAAPSNGPLYSFSATFYEAQPSRVFLQYFGTTDQGSSATVGMQGHRAGQDLSYQYSYNQPVITNGLSLIFDPAAGYFGQPQSSNHTM